MSRHKRELFEQLVTEVRRSQVATDRFDQAVGDALGVNRTDMRCMDILEREGPLPAGRLAEAAGLTSGAMTTAVDRLERAGFARRVRDEGDRRRVLIELTPEVVELTTRYYAGHAAMGEAAYERYNARELELLLDFVRRGREFNELRAAELEAANHREDADGEGPAGG
ncbi:MAG TPA: MarR family transcriptional regulator [Solirubrobacteraceae bacterium]|nr:MarR family transcriptional regulator [Solirubrobacteraceae bacterium]